MVQWSIFTKTQKLKYDFSAFCNTYNVLLNPNSKNISPRQKCINTLRFNFNDCIYTSKCFNNVPDMFGLLNVMEIYISLWKIICIVTLHRRKVATPHVFKNPASNRRVCYDWLSAVSWKNTDVCITVTRWNFQLNLQSLYSVLMNIYHK